MGKTVVKLIALLLALVGGLLTEPGQAASGPPEKRMTATVIEFSVRGDLNEQAGAIIADLMMSAIANTSRFTLKDRLPLSAAAKIAKAQELGSTGLLDPKTAAELGRLYEVDAVVTGGVYKLGDLITVTARLIDTKTASLLRSGQIQGKDIDTIQVKINELASMITAPPEAPPTHALTVKTDPADASVRLTNDSLTYQPGMRLPTADYELEVSKSGYLPHKEAVQIGDQDVNLTVVLEKARYGLTVRSEPADAQVRLIGNAATYRPGVALTPGDYQIEVSRDGYVSRKVTARIVDGDLSVPVTLEKTPAPRVEEYRLTVVVDPPRAAVRLLNAKQTYQSGMTLAPGDYTVEISQTGYESARVPVRIVDRDVTVPVSLTKLPEPARPASYRLTVRPDPATAKVRLVGSKTAYKPGIPLAPGNYTVEVSQKGYETRQTSVRIVDGDMTVPVALTKLPEPTQYRLSVQTDPPDAQVRLRGVKTRYRPGVTLLPGSYTVEVSRSGYETKQTSVQIVNGDVTVPVVLVKQVQPLQYRLTVQPTPTNARVRLVNSAFTYRPGVALPPGSYIVEVSSSGYGAKRQAVQIADGDVTVPVELEKIATAPPIPSSSSSAASTASTSVASPTTRPGEWRIASVQVDSGLNDLDRREVQRILGGYAGRTVTRDTLLDGALRVYQATGITLRFVVQSGAGGTASLHARVSRQVRRTYESSIPIMTRSQLESAGFGVSVE